MQNLGQRRKLELDVDALIEADDPEIVVLGKKAQTALKRNAYKDALELVTQAQALYRPAVPVAKLLCDKGKTLSRAAARRCIQGGAVTVDGIRLRKHDAKVGPDQVVTFKGEQIQGP